MKLAIVMPKIVNIVKIAKQNIKTLNDDFEIEKSNFNNGLIDHSFEIENVYNVDDNVDISIVDFAEAMRKQIKLLNHETKEQVLPILTQLEILSEKIKKLNVSFDKKANKHYAKIKKLNDEMIADINSLTNDKPLFKVKLYISKITTDQTEDIIKCLENEDFFLLDKNEKYISLIFKYDDFMDQKETKNKIYNYIEHILKDENFKYKMAIKNYLISLLR